MTEAHPLSRKFWKLSKCFHFVNTSPKSLFWDDLLHKRLHPEGQEQNLPWRSRYVDRRKLLYWLIPTTRLLSIRQLFISAHHYIEIWKHGICYGLLLLATVILQMEGNTPCYLSNGVLGWGNSGRTAPKSFTTAHEAFPATYSVFMDTKQWFVRKDGYIIHNCRIHIERAVYLFCPCIQWAELDSPWWLCYKGLQLHLRRYPRGAIKIIRHATALPQNIEIEVVSAHWSNFHHIFWRQNKITSSVHPLRWWLYFYWTTVYVQIHWRWNKRKRDLRFRVIILIAYCAFVNINEIESNDDKQILSRQMFFPDFIGIFGSF